MRRTPINQITLEGPDLSGKTTLYQKIHEKSGYHWNIQDRSSLSMIVYARLYGRSDYFHVEALKRDLSNLNNVMILLLPDWNVIAERFQKRGDEIQNLASLKKVYDLFSEAADEFENYPNVMTVKTEVDDNMVSYIVHNLRSHFERKPYHSYAELFKVAAATSENLEKVGLSLTHYDSEFDDVSEEMLRYEKEKVYYDKIRRQVLRKIDDELSGINEYSRIETHESRRFIYTDDSCLSLCHFVLRNEFLYGYFYFRSSETKQTLSYDMNFIKSLTRDVFSKLSEFSEIKMCKIELKIGSGHILKNSID
jgi:thymidylate kinase